MLSVAAEPHDDPVFVELVGQIIGQAVPAYGFKSASVVHLDHWFGERWLRFRGVFGGVLECRSSRRDREPGIPPFHPHRILSESFLWLDEQGAFQQQRASLPRSRCRSQTNSRFQLVAPWLHAWYSGDTVETERGAVMVYARLKRGHAAWYVGFERGQVWRVAKAVGISPERVWEMTEHSESLRL